MGLPLGDGSGDYLGSVGTHDSLWRQRVTEEVRGSWWLVWLCMSGNLLLRSTVKGYLLV